jgi:hypothetical protein
MEIRFLTAGSKAEKIMSKDTKVKECVHTYVQVRNELGHCFPSEIAAMRTAAKSSPPFDAHSKTQKSRRSGVRLTLTLKEGFRSHTLNKTPFL